MSSLDPKSVSNLEPLARSELANVEDWWTRKRYDQHLTREPLVRGVHEEDAVLEYGLPVDLFTRQGLTSMVLIHGGACAIRTGALWETLSM